MAKNECPQSIKRPLFDYIWIGSKETILRILGKHPYKLSTTFFRLNARDQNTFQRIADECKDSYTCFFFVLFDFGGSNSCNRTKFSPFKNMLSFFARLCSDSVVTLSKQAIRFRRILHLLRRISIKSVHFSIFTYHMQLIPVRSGRTQK